MQKRIAIGLSILAGIAGLAWLWASARFSLASRADNDVYRQWVSSQYVISGIDPYRVARDVLRQTFGDTRGEARMRLGRTRIYEVHPNFRTDGVGNYLPEYGPPTATYPPSSLLLLVFTVGLIPREFLLPAWLAVNLAALAWLVAGLARSAGRPSTGTLWPAAVIVLLWPPTHEVIRTAQFGFLVMIWLLSALRGGGQVREGLCFALMLLKPSLVLPLLVLPLVRRRWITLAVAAGLHVLGTLVMSALVGSPPWVLLAEWMEIPRYMLQGAYTIQEVINRLGLDNTTAGMGLTLGFVGLSALWCAWNRSAGDRRLLAFLVLVSLLWTYHERYDFVLLLIPLLWNLSDTEESSARRQAAIMAIFFVAIALTDAAYLGDHPMFRAVRWTGRLALACLFILAALDLRRRPAQAIRGSAD